MSERSDDEVRNLVRDRYAEVATQGGSGCGCSPGTDCGPLDMTTASAQLGYDPNQLATLPVGSNMGLGCGAPLGLALIKDGETVVDLGSGGGIDCFLAAREAGDNGYVIGVDMTPEMLLKARDNGKKGGYKNVDFRLGEIENLPIENDGADVILSNCVINLSPAKQRVFDEAFRVLKPGGRLAISDIVLSAELPEDVKNDPMLLTDCVSGAITPDELESMMKNAGFVETRVEPKDKSRQFIRQWAPEKGVEEYIVSAEISGRKPNQGTA